MNEILKLIGITIVPFLELRASIPYGLFRTSLSPLAVFFVTVISNILFGVVLYWMINNALHLLLRFRKLYALYQKTIAHAQKKVQPYIHKYGILGLAAFIAVPLPGSGVYSAALGASVLGFSSKDFFIATVIGVIIAGIIVMLISTAGNEALAFLIKTI